MRPDPEALVIAWGNNTDLLDAPFTSEVPAGSTGRFYTVERTGGASEHFRDLPSLAVQAWAPRRTEAANMIYDFQAAAWSELQYHDHVGRLTLNTVTHFPGPNGEPRYQALIELVTS